MVVESGFESSGILSSVITSEREPLPGEWGWVTVYCPELEVHAAGIDREDADMSLAIVIYAVASSVVQRKGRTEFSRDKQRLPVAEEVVRRIETGEEIESLLRDQERDSKSLTDISLPNR